MPSEAAFLARLADNPHDDTTRLVYADWLEERGDPRAAFLRAEVGLARLEPGTPEHTEGEPRLIAAREGLSKEWVACAGRPYDLVLRGYPAGGKIAVIKSIRELTGCGLAEGKSFSESLPATILGGASPGLTPSMAARASAPSAPDRCRPSSSPRPPTRRIATRP